MHTLTDVVHLTVTKHVLADAFIPTPINVADKAINVVDNTFIPTPINVVDNTLKKTQQQ